MISNYFIKKNKVIENTLVVKYDIDCILLKI